MDILTSLGVAGSERSRGAKDVGINKGRLMGVEKLRRERKEGEGSWGFFFFFLRIE